MRKLSLIALCFLNIILFFKYNLSYIYFFLQFNFCFILLENLISKSILYGSNVFLPLPITCFILFFSLIFAPIISLGEETYLFLAPRNIDWEKWLFILSLLYTIGILFFYLVANSTLRCNINKINFFKDEIINKKNLIIASFIFLGISFIAQVLIFLKFGGVMGYLNSWTEDREGFAGLGIWYMMAEPFPIILLIFLILLIGKERILINKYKWIISLFIIFFISKLIFGGFRGSRSNTIWGLFWFAGIVHIYLFPLKKIHYIFGIVFLVFFMSVYSIYKTYGVNAFSGDYSIEDTNRYNNNPIVEMYLGDFSRATVNGFQIAQIEDIGKYEYKFGQTYAYTFTMLLPFTKNLYNGYNKNSAGYELMTGYEINPKVEDYHNSRVFGLYGEGILNFGPLFSTFLFGLFGYIVAKLDNISRNFLYEKIYIFIIPFLGNVSFVILMADSDNVVFFIFKNGLLVLFYLMVLHYFCRKKWFKGE